MGKNMAFGSWSKGDEIKICLDLDQGSIEFILNDKKFQEPSVFKLTRYIIHSYHLQGIVNIKFVETNILYKYKLFHQYIFLIFFFLFNFFFSPTSMVSMKKKFNILCTFCIVFIQ